MVGPRPVKLKYWRMVAGFGAKFIRLRCEHSLPATSGIDPSSSPPYFTFPSSSQYPPGDDNDSYWKLPCSRCSSI